MELLYFKDCDTKINKGYRYILVVFEFFSKYAWTVSMENKTRQTIKDSSKNVLNSSGRKPNLIETDDGKEFVNKISTTFWN